MVIMHTLPLENMVMVMRGNTTAIHSTTYWPSSVAVSLVYISRRDGGFEGLGTNQERLREHTYMKSSIRASWIGHVSRESFLLYSFSRFSEGILVLPFLLFLLGVFFATLMGLRSWDHG